MTGGERRFTPYVCANGHRFAIAFEVGLREVKCACCGTITVAPEPESDLVPESLLSAERSARQAAEKQWQEAIDNANDVGGECSRLEADQLDIHDALEAAGLRGAINAESIRDRIALLAQERDEARLVLRRIAVRRRVCP